MNKKETKRIADWLESIGATITNSDGAILWHATLPYKGPMRYRDENKTLVEVRRPVFNIYFEAGVNPGGVGDGQLPDPALTYSLGMSVPSRERGYRQWYWYDTGSRDGYNYDRTLEGLKSKTLQHLAKTNL